MIIEQNNVLYPIEIKKTSMSSKNAPKSFSFLEKLKRNIWHGIVICLTEKDIPFLGIRHDMQYDELPTYCKELLMSADVVFHEWINGVVFLDPFQFPEHYIYDPTNSTHFKWVDKLSLKQIEETQALINYYFKVVKRQKENIPNVKTIRLWAVEEIAFHFHYYMTGNEIDHTLHWHRQREGKKIIDLDVEYLVGQMGSKIKEEKKKDEGEDISLNFLLGSVFQIV